jgi:hypothetical protein
VQAFAKAVPHLHTLKLPFVEVDDPAVIAALLAHPSLAHLQVNLRFSPTGCLLAQNAHHMHITCTQLPHKYFEVAMCFRWRLMCLSTPQLFEIADYSPGIEIPQYHTSGRLQRLELDIIDFKALGRLPDHVLIGLAPPPGPQSRLEVTAIPVNDVPGFGSRNPNAQVRRVRLGPPPQT